MENDEKSIYFLACLAFGKPFRVPISKERFEDLEQAWENLRHLAHVEEEWHAVVQNYVELEKSLLDAALSDMIGSDQDYFTFQRVRLRFAVKMSNLLSSCRAYIDHTPHHLGKIAPVNQLATEFKVLARGQYDERLG